MTRAFVSGITGQDGAHLAQFLLSKDYSVYGLVRRQSAPNFDRLRRAGVLNHPNFELVEGDLTDPASLDRFLSFVRPEEVYNLAAQSHVKVSFDEPVHSTQVDLIGVLHLLEIIRNRTKSTKFYQAGTSEMFGGAPAPQNEASPFFPESPYACAKLAAYWNVRNYRRGYGLFACTGILFNHEGPYRGEAFVTRKITRYAAALKKTVHEPTAPTPLHLGNLDAKRDWGYAGDYVEAMWMMLQQAQADDYVIGTGESRTVREFVDAAFQAAFPGQPLKWTGSGVDERAYLNGVLVVVVDPKFYRPIDVHVLCADTTKARNVLGWKPKTRFADLVRIMVEADCKDA
jgi:GDPmannose 4,6-dehydratase